MLLDPLVHGPLVEVRRQNVPSIFEMYIVSSRTNDYGSARARNQDTSRSLELLDHTPKGAG